MSNMQMATRPVQLGAMLDQLLAGRWPPASWQPVRAVDELPCPLEKLACTLSRGSWRAYADGACVALAAGEPAGERDIAVRFYDGSARLCAAGIWSPDAAGSWQLRQIVD